MSLSGVIIIPHAWVPIFLIEPSITSACFNTSDSKVFCFLISDNSGTSLNASIRFTLGLSGINFASLSEAFKLILEYDSDLDEFFGLNADIYKSLRYGENPHQKGIFKGNIDDVFEKLNGKELSYNNLLDIDSAIRLIAEFNDTTFAIIKHNNACGIASSSDVLASYQLALEADPLSAFGGVLVTNIFKK